MEIVRFLWKFLKKRQLFISKHHDFFFMMALEIMNAEKKGGLTSGSRLRFMDGNRTEQNYSLRSFSSSSTSSAILSVTARKDSFFVRSTPASFTSSIG